MVNLHLKEGLRALFQNWMSLWAMKSDAMRPKNMAHRFPSMKTLLVLLAFRGLPAAGWAGCPRMDSVTKHDIEDSHFSKVFHITTNMAL
ncbi:hypothetical protein Y032_0017g3241 [Ancylostoma ceylanicum]|nr:hypothetical protein Y032_0017g3241 [Ancylostoma ceylanicum]